MGLDYSFLLFFGREQVWDVLQGLAKVCSHHQPPTKIIFPDHELLIPLMTWSWNDPQLHYDDEDLDFQIAMHFPGEDKAIMEFNRNMGNEKPDRSPPDDENADAITVGLIYLSIYLNDDIFSSPEYVLFKFTAAGTTMSILFQESPSIQKGFVELLKSNNGVSGVLDTEEGGGKLFWYRGKAYDIDIYDSYMRPDEIEKLLEERNQANKGN